MKLKTTRFPFRKHIIPALLGSILLLSLTACQSGEPQRTYHFYYSDEYWTRYDFSHSPFPTQESFETQVPQYIAEIEDLLQLPDWYAQTAPNADNINLIIQIGNSNASWSYPPARLTDDTIELSIILEREALELAYGNDASLAHELTHCIAGQSFSNSLEEGLCNYVQAHVGATPYKEYPEWTEHEMWKVYLENAASTANTELPFISDELLATIGVSGGYPYGISTANGALWYQYSEMFVTYLIETYGMDKTMELIRTGTDEGAYKQYLGKELDELKAEWIAWFETLEPSMTFQEMVAVETEYVERFKNQAN